MGFVSVHVGSSHQEYILIILFLDQNLMANWNKPFQCCELDGGLASCVPNPGISGFAFAQWKEMVTTIWQPRGPREGI